MLLFPSFPPLQPPSFPEVPAGYCGNGVAHSRLFFEVCITHSFIKHLRIWYVLGSNYGTKESKRLGSGLKSISLATDLGYHKKQGYQDHKDPVSSLEAEVVATWERKAKGGSGRPLQDVKKGTLSPIPSHPFKTGLVPA